MVAAIPPIKRVVRPGANCRGERRRPTRNNIKGGPGAGGVGTQYLWYIPDTPKLTNAPRMATVWF